MYAGAGSGIQRLLRYPSIILSAAGILVAILISMVSLELSIEATANNQRKQLPRWFSDMDPSILTPYWLLSPFGFLPRNSSEREQHYDWNVSTEDNYRSDTLKFHGTFRFIRQRLDRSYHSNYSPNRQSIQDSIIESMICSTKVKDADSGRECSVPTDPWIIFTAGVYGRLLVPQRSFLYEYVAS